ncbi:MAG: 50S ribosomal protein L9 [Flavobacteriales bacterium]|jgi:large subunit ribosomal protein L9|nr:50S ribosomal protein L9 [Schleiferiaceae bacterium]|tara:strand:- start:779 stop:1228 length:450 start_codon:yes stop_codon:yes gene_type:complete
MEIILRKDVENVGFTDDVVIVKDGYGRNFLIPQGLGSLATESAKKVLAENLRQRAHKEAKAVTDAQAMAEKLSAIELKMTAKTGQGNKLFGSITNQHVADELSKNGVTLEKKFIQIVGGSIKALGNYTVAVRLHRTVVVNIEFDVVAEA